MRAFYEPSLGVGIDVVPLSLSFVSTIFLDFVRFWRRRKLVHKIDKKTVITLRDHGWAEILWQDLCVGDVILLKNGDVAPSDIVILCSSNSQPCAIDTHIIDGSKQLKSRSPNKGIQVVAKEILLTDGEICLEYCRESVPSPIDVSRPPELYAKIQFQARTQLNAEEFSLGNSQYIERYSIIYHSGEIIAGVVYTGTDCRGVQHNHHAIVKFTGLEKILNIQNSLQVLLLTISAVFAGLFSLNYQPIYERWPINTTIDRGDLFLHTFFQYMHLLLPLVPLEIYFFIDLLLYIHSLFIESSDNEMSAPSVSAIDELTQIDTIIASKSLLIDKSPNVLRIYSAETYYGMGQLSSDIAQCLLNGQQIIPTPTKKFFDSSFIPSGENSILLLHFALCHSALVISRENYIDYVSSFAEDEPLLHLSSHYGINLVKRTPSEAIVLMNEKPSRFRIIQSFPPSPQHPRVSILFIDIDGCVKLFIRGDCDSMRDHVAIPADIENRMRSQGLQVICCSYKVLSPEDIHRFQENMSKAKTQNADFIFNFISEFEKQGVFLGLIGFEEEPRAGSLSLISSSINAGIQLVMTYSSKGSSLIITALSLGLVTNQQTVGIITGNTPQDVANCINSLENSKKFDILLVSGSSIEHLSAYSRTASSASECIRSAKVVLLERTDPFQAALFVDLLRKKVGMTVMGAGHSVSDSIFLHLTDISISVDLDPVCPCDISSDFVVSKLDSLVDVIFVQGGWIRERIFTFLNFIYPRNMIFGFLQLCYGFECALSGTPLFDEGQVLSVLLFFGIIPILSRSIFNQKMPRSLLKASPKYYQRSRVERLSLKRFLLSSLLSFIAAYVLLFLSKLIVSNARKPYGESISRAQFSFYVSSMFISSIIGFLIPQCETWNTPHHVLFWGSFIMYFAFSKSSTESTSSGQMRGAVSSMSGTVIFSMSSLLWIGFTFFLQFSYSLWRKSVSCECKKSEKDLLQDIDTEEIHQGSTIIKRVFDLFKR